MIVAALITGFVAIANTFIDRFPEIWKSITGQGKVITGAKPSEPSEPVSASASASAAASASASAAASAAPLPPPAADAVGLVPRKMGCAPLVEIEEFVTTAEGRKGLKCYVASPEGRPAGSRLVSTIDMVSLIDQGISNALIADSYLKIIAEGSEAERAMNQHNLRTAIEYVEFLDAMRDELQAAFPKNPALAPALEHIRKLESYRATYRAM